MINLIPNEERKKIKKNFYMRLAITSFVVLGLALLTVDLMLVPSLFFSSKQENVVLTQLSLTDDYSSFNKDTGGVVEKLENKLNIIKGAQENQFHISDRVIDRVLSHKISGIHITNIDYADSLEEKKINIGGIADSREVLLLFKSKIEKDQDFSKVSLPISNFVQSTNLEFTIMLTPS